MYCQYCGSAIGNDAQFCGSCGRRQIAAPGPRSPLATPKKGNWITRHPIWSLLIAFVVLGHLFAGDSPKSEKQNLQVEEAPKPPTDRNKYLAPVKCEEAVTAQLKSPSTANFASYSSRQVTDDGNGKYYVRSYVDSQNSFGAQIRTGFLCKVQCAGVDACQVVQLLFDQ
jgi:hypothetical protein